MTICVTRRRAILTAFTKRWLWSEASRRRPTQPLSSFSRQHPILTTAAARSYRSRGVRCNTSQCSYISFLGFTAVPEKKVLVIERLGQHRKMLSLPGIYFVVPFLDRVALEHDLRERYISVQQFAVTKDGFRIFFEVTLYVKTVDVFLASYRVPAPYADHISATIGTASTALQRRVWMQTLEKTIFEPLTLEHAILMDIAPVMETWGIKCQNYYLSVLSYRHLITEEIKWGKVFAGLWRKICGFARMPGRAETREESTSPGPT